MSFDPFEARMQFLQLLRKLNATQQSIQKVVGYAIKYGSKCGEDLWECILEQCAKGSLNTRINLLYLLDALLEVSLPLPLTDAPYPPLIADNLVEIVKRVVPEGEGVLNLRSAKQILDSWRTRRLIEPERVDEALKVLDGQKGEGSSKRSRAEAFSKGDIIRRMEEDRERHKRLRERIWILPIPPLAPAQSGSSGSTGKPSSARTNPSPLSNTSPFTPASPAGAAKAKGGRQMLPPPAPPPGTGPAGVQAIDPLEVEFDQLWENGSELDPEDLERMKEDSMMLSAVEAT